jgi:molecular chaperone GrpE
MELIYQRLYESLKKIGLEPISTEGTLFNPHLHHAVDMVDSPDSPDQTILEEYQRGYNFKGRLLRPAMVKVAVRQ